jgi:hypothetical protein
MNEVPLMKGEEVQVIGRAHSLATVKPANDVS